MGLAAFLVWQALVGPAIVAWSPSGFRARLASRLPAGVAHHLGRPRRVALTLLALLLGATTHVLWDEFTHKGRWGEHHIAWLAQSHGPLPGYRWAQYASGVVGLSLLVVWGVRWWRTHPVRPSVDVQPVRTWGTRIGAPLLIVLSTVAGGAYGFVTGLADPVDPARRALFLTATHSGGVGATALFAAALAWRLSRPHPHDRVSS